MSGFEVAGLALAVLPVLMSAAQTYNNCVGPFHRYRKFAKEAHDYCEELEIQRTIFRDLCRNFLEELIDHDTANCMLKKLDQQTWADEKLDEQLVQLLGESLDRCKGVVGLIGNRLQDISGESLNFGSIVDQEKKSIPKAARDRLWRKRVGEKFAFSVSKSRLDENIVKLRAYNVDFKSLIESASRTHQTAVLQMAYGSKPTRTVGANIRKYRTVAKASFQTYQALRKSCTKHEEHMAHFKIEVECSVLDQSTKPQVKFDMAFTHHVSTNNSHTRDLIWFLIDSIISDPAEIESHEPHERVVEFKKSLKRCLEPTVCPTKKEKFVRFETPVLPSLSKACLPLTATCPIILGNTISIDFCDSLRRHFGRPVHPGTCIILEDTASCKQVVYPTRRGTFANVGTSISLGQLIKSTNNSNDVGFRILLHERLSLAKKLAIAVLQYHTTPWLQQSCCSEDILFFDLDTNVRTRRGLPIPYFNARIQGQSTHPPASTRSTIPQNPVLFNLGVIFIELAYAASLETFTRSCDAENGLLHQRFFTARRIAKMKCTDMGPTYDNIVEDLVEGAFSYGANLDNPKMQAALYERVINPLDNLEQGFRNLRLGSVLGN